MALKGKIQDSLARLLPAGEQGRCVIKKAVPVGGGSINKAYKLETNRGNYFLKINSASKYPLMFGAEVKGLELLRSAGELFVPAAVSTGEEGDDAFIIMDFIEQGKRAKDFFFDFGKRLARLHKHSAERFGLAYDNYIGSLPQSNTAHESWADFFIQERLERQLKLGRDSGALGSSLAQGFGRLFRRLEEIFPVERPSLVHGDLWSGNYMTGPDGTACLFDPAVYYGHREMDIAMSRLFGGFDRDFYLGYNEEFPMEKGWEQRSDICNLYPLLVHVNLFGGSYASQVEAIIRRF
ncbi:MAG: fructosamine kinase family protein [Bacteroidota bacterium]